MTMRAAVFHGQQRISIVDAAMPQPGPGEVLLQVRRTALCGSDNKLWHKGADHTPGHEIFGLVRQPGHAMDGRRCLVYIPVHCGACASCTAGDTQMCQTESVLVGWNRPGGYAQWLAVPEQCLLPVPDDIDDDLAPLLLDTIGTAAHAIRWAGPLAPPAGSAPVLVIGAGPVGLGALLALLDRGDRAVHIADLRPDRLALAQRLGAQAHPVGGTDTRFGLVLECSGAHAARQWAIETVAPRGVVVLVGENDQPWPFTETRAVRRKDFCMVRSFYFPKADHALNIGLLRRHAAAYRQLVDARFGLDQLPQVYARFAAGELVKPLLAFD